MRKADQPSDPARLSWMLGKAQTWQPYVDGNRLDDVAAVLDNYVPSKDEVEALGTRLRSHLRHMVQLAVTSQADQRDPEVADLVKRAQDARSAALGEDHSEAVGHLRQLAWRLDAFLERLVENQCLRERP
ncbi:DUF6415 family natural product biosynthesis protein [Streptomyces sp. ML-6]|uniref:DUF6415 family natural product biosynthesis protein n=1 Tax=Streptomyces sp. ML-6 TaxID=2982693 RepID=UPI0024BFF7E5|nr:DUF6415 family natural product biosynthesis protein [Streptomyces sp. ML-6]MDK0519581.1 DUF6415 family natural product biosynthesis protein [Streptomyces sp. ML-6]